MAKRRSGRRTYSPAGRRSPIRSRCIFSPLHLALAALDATPSFHAADLVTFAYLFAGGLALMLFFPRPRLASRRRTGGGADLRLRRLGGIAASAHERNHQPRLSADRAVATGAHAGARVVARIRASARRDGAIGAPSPRARPGRHAWALIVIAPWLSSRRACWLDAPGRIAWWSRRPLRAASQACAADVRRIAACAAVPLSFSALLAADSPTARRSPSSMPPAARCIRRCC